jgi:chromosome segregation protein
MDTFWYYFDPSPMYLKRLEINGFKSFANATVLQFLPPRGEHFSVTAVVGPNGSGKSNVTDAIRWVMGETSLKSIRGKKSDDVIFNGSAAKGAMSLAEVSMVLDNTNRPVDDIDAEEVVITRRLYRSGETEYLINQNPVRLLDIHLLMAKAGMAENSYSMVSQGMIDKLLTVNPAERKDFFDEACGIKEFQIKRHQADLKLARTAEHLEQANVVLQEIEPRLKLLSKQVKKLEERHEVETELLAAQESYYVTLYQRNKIEYDALLERLQGINVRHQTSFTELEFVQSELATLAGSSTRQEVFDELQAAHQKIVREKNAVEKQLAILEGQMHTEYSHAGQHNVSWLEGKVSEIRLAAARSGEEVGGAEVEQGRLDKALKEERYRLDTLTVARTETNVTIARLQNQLLKDQSEQNYLNVSGLTAVKAVLDARDRFGKVYGLVAELGEVSEEYRLALEVAAGQHLSSIVVDNEGVARLAINYLRDQRFGVATFLPLTKLQARSLYRDEEALLSHPDVIGLALNLVKFDAEFQPVFSFIFGSTMVVADLEAAQRVGIGSVRMVTLAGDVAEKNGVMRGGYRTKKSTLSFSSKLSLSADDRLQEYQAAINREQARLVELEEQIKDSQTKLVEVHGQAQGCQAKVRMMSTQKEQLDLELSRLEQELRVLTSNPEEYGKELQRLAQEKEAALGELARLETDVVAAARAIEDYNRLEEEKKQRVFALQESMQAKQVLVNTITQEQNDVKIALAKVETRREDLAVEVQEELKMVLSSLVERVQTIVAFEELDALSDTIQKLKYKLSLIGGIDEEVIKEYEATKERYDFLSGQLNDLQKATTDLNTLIGELDETMKKRRTVAFRKIRKEFSRYFQILFEGGEADLEEIYGEEPVEGENPEPGTPTEDGSAEPEKPSKKEKILTGIEVIANPPGKKIKYLNSLSGGERTLTSIALICAILHDNPSPFVVLDEVEAALDEANTQRFVRIMSELSTQSQFIVITHNRVTMHAADALYGVVMNGDGISQLLSVKMEEVARFAEPNPAAVSVDKQASLL